LTPTDRPKIDPAKIKKVLLVRPRRLGDIILTTPALRALKSALPQAKIFFLLESPYRRLIQGNGLVEEVIAIQPKLNWIGLSRLIMILRKYHFDLAIDFHGGPRSALITLGSGSRLRVGYRTQYKSWAYHMTVARSSPAGPIHSVVNHLNLVRAAGLNVGDDFSLCVAAAQPEEKKTVDACWQEWGLSSKKVIALHISAGNQFRDWGQENIVNFLKRIGPSGQILPLLIGSKEDKKREKEIIEALGRPLPSLVGNTSLGELTAALERVDLFVGPDSGPMHLAAALGRPIVALFGPTLPAHFSPWKARAVILERKLACRPCRQRTCPYSNYPCIKGIEAEEVAAASLELLRTCGQPQRSLG